MKSVEEFQSFDLKLCSKSIVYEDLYKHFNSAICVHKDLLETLNVWFQAFFSYDCLQHYTTQKVIKDHSKLVFKDTYFYVCLREGLLKAFNKPTEPEKLSEKTLKSILGTIISNYAKDWNGGRRKREK